MMFRDTTKPIESAKERRRFGGDRWRTAGWDEEPVNEEEKPCSQVEAPRPIESEDGGEGASHPDFSDSGFGRTLCPPSPSAFAFALAASSTFAPLPLLCPVTSLLDPRRSKVPSLGHESAWSTAPPEAPTFTPRSRPFNASLRFRVNPVPTHAPHSSLPILLVISSPTCPPILLFFSPSVRSLAHLTFPSFPFLSSPLMHLVASSPLLLNWHRSRSDSTPLGFTTYDRTVSEEEIGIVLDYFLIKRRKLTFNAFQILFEILEN